MNDSGLVVQQLNKVFSVEGGLFLTSRGHVRALNNINFSLPSGQTLGIVGESGSGKTTLAKIMAGFFKPDSGTITFNGQNLISLKRKNRSELIQMVFQDPFSSLNPKLPLRVQLSEALATRQQRTNEEERMGNLLTDVGLNLDHINRYPHELSGGQRQRFAIARALAKEPSLLLADEPVSSLDLSVQAQIINLLNSLRNKRNFTLVIISHDLAVISHLADSVLVLKDGNQVEYGPSEKIIHHPESDYTRTLIDATPMV